MSKQKYRGHCQVCGREIGSTAGLIAHHGYERPQGWYQQTKSCRGARELPFEKDRAVLGEVIEDIKTYINDLTVSLAALNEDRNGTQIGVRVSDPNQTPKPRYRSDIIYITVWVTKENFDAQAEVYGKRIGWEDNSWEYLRTRRARATGFDLEQTQKHLEREQQRYDGWSLKELRKV